MKKLGVEPAEVDVFFLSHRHGDHTKGLVVYLPESFPLQLKRFIVSMGGFVEAVTEGGEYFQAFTRPVNSARGYSSRPWLLKRPKVYWSLRVAPTPVS